MAGDKETGQAKQLQRGMTVITKLKLGQNAIEK
jgi:hypothetical protein